jgi:hypothetical protein
MNIFIRSIKNHKNPVHIRIIREICSNIFLDNDLDLFLNELNFGYISFILEYGLYPFEEGQIFSESVVANFGP